VTSRIFSGLLVGLLLLTAACTGDGQSPAPDDRASPSAVSPSGDPTEPAPPSDEPTEPGPDPSATQALGSDEQDLMDRVRDEGTLSVIVEVDLEGTAAANSAEQRQLITEAQDDLITELDPAHVSVQTRFRNTAQLTLTVDEDGLLALYDSPRVTRVWPNESIPLD
jgi:hypothetical protein